MSVPIRSKDWWLARAEREGDASIGAGLARGPMKARKCEGGRLAFWCPGCDGAHVVIVDGPGAWGFNGSLEAPTLTPSVLVRTEEGHPPVTHENFDEYKRAPWVQTKVQRVCHSFVADGRIQFLGDCTHALAGQTVPLAEWPTGHWD